MQLELKSISKHFGRIRANDGVDLTVNAGSIHAVLGENGAGKSTLMKVLAGYLVKTAGEIVIDGEKVDVRSPAEASGIGIGMLYQDPLDFPNLSVLDNFMMGQVRGMRLSTSAYRDRLAQWSARFQFDLQPTTMVAQLTVGERQQLELLRLLSLGTRLLILDEPTTGISTDQKTVLFNALKQLAAEGKSILLVSHKLEDVVHLCDTLTVLRRGRVAGCLRAPFETGNVLALMFDDVPAAPARHSPDVGAVVLEMDGVSGSGGRTGLLDSTVAAHKGEVIGLAGLEGSGQGVFLRLAAGLQTPTNGTVSIESRSMAGRDHHDFLTAGVAFLPSGRLEDGLLPGLTITEHIALKYQRGAFFIRWPEAHRTAMERIAQYRIAGTPDTAVESLSGGNQQRLLLSFLPPAPKLLLLENPTRGLDVESAMWFWDHLLAQDGSEASIVFSSSELDEILMVASRVLVFFDGRIIADAVIAETDSSFLGRAIAGTV